LLDCLIIGAGMAGLAAGRRLSEAGRSVELLEVRARSGGRAHSVEAEGLTFDLGCHWFHSANRNPLVPLARQLGFEVEEYAVLWAKPWNLKKLGAKGEELAAAFERLGEAMAATLGGRDPALSALIARTGGEWQGFLAAAYSWSSGALASQLSTHDLAQGQDIQVNWRTPSGLGRVVQRYARGLPLRLEAPVERLRLTAKGVEASGPFGRLEARAAIVAVPVSRLERLGFEPGLPEGHRRAIAGLPLGCNEKIFFRVEGEPFGPHEDFQANLAYDRVETAHYHIHEFGRPTVEAYFGGPLARRLASEGQAALAAFALDELAGEFGSKVRRQLRPLASTAWCADPWLEGAYSYALPGEAGAREALAQPIEQRLFFAGEATSVAHAASLNGAYESGRRAAAEVLSALG
jgi:monoamine oxidase